jgi:DNA-binding MarR family transcriptional regulator
MAAKFRVTVKEKILIHLLNFSKYRDQFEVPSQTSQDGIAKAVGVRRSHVASALKDLREKDQVEEKKTRIQGVERRKNAYFLTVVGQAEALRLKENLMEKMITFKGEDGAVKEITISQINKNIEDKLGLVEILNRISGKGVFDVRGEEAEEERIEKSIQCPFCGQITKNPDLGQPQIHGDATAFLTPCMYCGREFLVRETGEGRLIPLGPVFEQAPPEQMVSAQYFPPVRSFSTGDAFQVSLGLFFMMASFILALAILLDRLSLEFMALAGVGLAVSLILLSLGIMNVRHLNAITRRVLIITSTIFVGFLTLFLGVMLDLEYELEQAGVMAFVVLPAFGVFIFGKPLAKSLRSELSYSLGIFLVLFGIFSMAFYEMFSSHASMSPFWVIAGAAMVLTSYEIERLDRIYIWRAICVGTGAFMAMFCVMIIVSGYSSLGMLKMISAALWLLLGFFLITMRFMRKRTSEKAFTAVKNALFMAVGVIFVLIGVLLALNDRYMECAVELFIGLPIIGYSLTMAKEYEGPQLGIIAFIIASVVLTLLSLFFF